MWASVLTISAVFTVYDVCDRRVQAMACAEIQNLNRASYDDLPFY